MCPSRRGVTNWPSQMKNAALMLTAAPIAGSPSLTFLLGRDAAAYYQRFLTAARPTPLAKTDRYRRARERLEQLRGAEKGTGGDG